MAVYGVFGGRFDQVMAVLNSAYSLIQRDPSKQIYLFSAENWGALLAPHMNHQITCRPSREGPSCGLVPLGTTQATIKTTGLKWNLGILKLEMKHLM